MKKKAPYIIMAPPYRDDSAGVRVLYELRRHLEKRGYEARITQGEYAPPDAIVVYPETISGNPMNGKIVVRYILNHPGLLGGDKEYNSKEILFTCNGETLRKYVPSDDHVLCIPIIEDFFKDEKLSRKGGCFYIGKGTSIPRIPETKGMKEIIGMNRKEVAYILKTSEIFYTYDNFSLIIEEAKKCGCPVVVIGGEISRVNYDDHIKDFDIQLNNFIRITQAEASRRNDKKISFGVMINDMTRLEMVLKQSQIQGEMHYIKDPESATKGLNKLLDIMETEGADIAILTHQDMYYYQGWIDQVRDQISKLPESWIIAGIIGKDMKGLMCGNFHDMRIPLHFNTSNIHEFPQLACCLDECCIIVNMKKKFRFDETMDGFDLYGTLAILQTWEQDGTAWILDAFAEHYCMRKFNWFPNEGFCKNFKWLYNRFINMPKIDSTALGISKEKRFETSAA